MEVKCTFTEMVDIDLLVPNPRNANKHPDEQIKLLAKIMKHQGWRRPVVVSKRSGFVVAGHGRLLAAKLNGWSSAPVDRQDYASEADEYADMIADNKIAELAETNMAMVQSELENFPDIDLDLFGILDFDKLIDETTMIENVNKGDEKSEWVEMPEFEEASKDIKLTVIFTTELERELFAQKNKLPITSKHSGQWTSRA